MTMTSTQIIGGIGVALLFLLMGWSIRRHNKRRAAEIDKEVRQLIAEVRRHG